MCHVCYNDNESIYHALVDCPFVTQCWRTSFPDILMGQFNYFSDWLQQNFHRTSSDIRVGIVVLCWAIWRARNELVWNQKHTQVHVLVNSAKHRLIKWRTVQNWSSKALFQNQIVGDGEEKWVKPQVDNIKVTTDAATFFEFQAYGYGLIARDCNGDLIQAKPGYK